MKVNISMDLKKEEVSLFGQMEIHMKVSLKTIRWKGLEYLNGKIRNMKGNGRIVKWMDKENLDGMMVENILEVIKMIKKMVMVNFIGQMVNIIKVNGKMENNMELLFIKVKTCQMKDNVILKKENEQNG